jgi:hypothetical protein
MGHDGGVRTPDELRHNLQERALARDVPTSRLRAEENPDSATGRELRRLPGGQYDPNPHSPARSPRGNIRNVRAMSDSKLTDLAEQMVGSEDVEALEAVHSELASRNLGDRAPAEDARRAAVLGGGAEGRRAMEEGFRARAEGARAFRQTGGDSETYPSGRPTFGRGR